MMKMDELDQIFKQSSELDRNFSVPDFRWTDLERDLDQNKKRPFFGIRWIHLLVFGALVGVMGMREPRIQTQTQTQTQNRPQSQLQYQFPSQGREIEDTIEIVSVEAIGVTASEVFSMANEEISYDKDEAIPPTQNMTTDLMKTDPLESSEIQATNASDRIQDLTIPNPALPKSHELEVDHTSSDTPPTVETIDTFQRKIVQQYNESSTAGQADSKERLISSLSPLSSAQTASQKAVGERFAKTFKTSSAKSFIYTPATGSSLGLYIPPSDAPTPYEQADKKGNWQVSLNFGGLFGSNARRLLSYYSTEPGNPSASQLYTFPNGDTTRLYFLGSVVERQRGLALQAFQLDLHRVTSSGIGAKLGITYAYINDDNSNMADLVPRLPNVFYFTSSSRLSFFVAELGLDYTFNRGGRLQPRIGITAFTVLSSQGNSESFAFQPDQNYQNLESSSKTSSTQANLFGYYFESGAQWILNDKFSVGPRFNFAGLPFVTNIILGGGIEARYRF